MVRPRMASVQPKHERRAAGRADRALAVGFGENDTFAGKSVEMGSDSRFVSVTTEARREVIGDDEKDVRLCWFGGD
jgi:hypothetical protein